MTSSTQASGVTANQLQLMSTEQPPVTAILSRFNREYRQKFTFRPRIKLSYRATAEKCRDNASIRLVPLPSNHFISSIRLSFYHLTQNILHTDTVVKSKTTQTPWLLARNKPITTERPPLVSKVSANFCGQRCVAWPSQQIYMAVKFRFLGRNRYSFIQVAPQLSSRD
jgi:hypothetical protein